MPIALCAGAIGWLERLGPTSRHQRAFDIAGGGTLVLAGLYMLNAYYFFVPARPADHESDRARIGDNLQSVRPPHHRVDAYECVPILLPVRCVQFGAASTAGTLLRVLLVRLGEVPAGAASRTAAV